MDSVEEQWRKPIGESREFGYGASSDRDFVEADILNGPVASRPFFVTDLRQTHSGGLGKRLSGASGQARAPVECCCTRFEDVQEGMKSTGSDCAKNEKMPEASVRYLQGHKEKNCGGCRCRWKSWMCHHKG
jgi:hypothetical protein